MATVTNFRGAVLEASKQVRLGFWKRAKLRWILSSSRLTDRLMRQCLVEAQAAAVVPLTLSVDGVDAQIDWSAVLEWLIENLPTIISLILLFL